MAGISGASIQEDAMVSTLLDEPREAPSIKPDIHLVRWSIFRNRQQAELFIGQLRLGSGQRLAGGTGHDALGSYWWAGVRADTPADTSESS